MNPEASPDVLIVGAGPAGLALATALARAGLRSRVVEQQPLAAIAQPAEDGREIALTHRGRRILQDLGHWERIPAAEISLLREARVSSGDSPFALPFDARSAGQESLGWLVPNWQLRQVAYEAAAAEALVTLDTGRSVTGLLRDGQGATLKLADGGELRAPIVVAADSRFSAVRRMAGIGAQMLDFGRTAIVVRFEHGDDHRGIAHECFRYGNTLATLPLPGQLSSAVVTLKADEAPHWLALSDTDFAARLQAQLGGRLGQVRMAGRRHHYPLVAVYAQRFATSRFALAGDAAVGMHPVTAHGYNFGLYSVEVLARELAKGTDDPALIRYAAEHRRVTWPIYEGTNAVVRLFTDDRLPAKLLRGAVLRVASALPPVRELVARQLTTPHRTAATQTP
ncbi:MAG: 5-demethoxyubiquinol-8 5-hydroxylase UbiM [Rubrivivax sp.]|nr:5-demethoxyubiquinol-8 5-hydroxylase UbiM [Rubrivivax sp.]